MAEKKDSEIVLRNVRISFPFLHEKQAGYKGGKDSYGGHFIFGNNSANHTLVLETIQKVGLEKWGKEWPVVWAKLQGPKADFCCLRNGNLRRYEGYADNWYLVAKSKDLKPFAVDVQGKGHPLSPAEDKCKAGDYVYAYVDIYAFEKDGTQMIGANLQGVQFFRKGDRLAGGSAMDEERFEDLSMLVADGAGAEESFA